MTQTFSSCVDDQIVLIDILITVYEGDCAMVKDNLIIVKILLQVVPPVPRGVPWVEISFHIDSNGVFHMFALEMSTGKEQKITIEYDNPRIMPPCDFDWCHSLEERDRHIHEAEHYRFEDEAMRVRVEKRNAIENYAFFHGEDVREKECY
jgi:molecular chaperone DnaK (HSP70)